VQCLGNRIDRSGWDACLCEQSQPLVTITRREGTLKQRLQSRLIPHARTVDAKPVIKCQLRHSEHFAQFCELTIISHDEDDVSVAAGIDFLWLYVGMGVAGAARNRS